MVRHGIALFGLGRAGMIHTLNIIANHRCRLLYVVDVDEEKMKDTCEKYNLGDVKAVTPDQMENVITDPA